MDTVALRREVTRVIAAQVTPVTPTLLVRRALPAAGLRSVGPWVLLDHFGPLHAAPAGRGDTITYLLEGDGDGMERGLQFDAQLPRALQFAAPAARRYAAESLAAFRAGDAQVRVLSGELQGRRGPAPAQWPLLLAHVSLAGRGRAGLQLPAGFEFAAYVARGQVRLGEVEADAGKLLRLSRDGVGIEVANDLEERADVVLLGGAPLAGPM